MILLQIYLRKTENERQRAQSTLWQVEIVINLYCTRAYRANRNEQKKQLHTLGKEKQFEQVNRLANCVSARARIDEDVQHLRFLFMCSQQLCCGKLLN